MPQAIFQRVIKAEGQVFAPFCRLAARLLVAQVITPVPADHGPHIVPLSRRAGIVIVIQSDPQPPPIVQIDDGGVYIARIADFNVFLLHGTLLIL